MKVANAAPALNSLHGNIAEANRQSGNLRKINEKAEEFQAVFMNEMLGQMFNNVEVNKEFGGGSAEKIWRSLLINEYSKTMATDNKLGVSGLAAQQMLKIQEGK